MKLERLGVYVAVTVVAVLVLALLVTRDFWIERLPPVLGWQLAVVTGGLSLGCFFWIMKRPKTETTRRRRRLRDRYRTPDDD